MAVRLPTIVVERHLLPGSTFSQFGRGVTAERAMGAVLAVIDPEMGELSLQILSVPEQCGIKKFSTNRSNQSFDERMRSWNIGNTFDLLDRQDT